MFVLGHLGIGTEIASPWSRGLPRKPLLLGTLLPDLIDKPLYYAGALRGTRTFGHTAIFLLVIGFSAFWRKSKALAALALGVATHLLLDNGGDTLGRMLHWTAPHAGIPGVAALVWPLMGKQFPVAPYHSLADHWRSLQNPLILWGEALGALFLLWEFWKSRHEAEVLARRRVRISE